MRRVVPICLSLAASLSLTLALCRIAEGTSAIRFRPKQKGVLNRALLKPLLRFLPAYDQKDIWAVPLPQETAAARSTATTHYFTPNHVFISSGMAGSLGRNSGVRGLQQ